MTTIENKKTVNPFLRVVVGETITRKEMLPIYNEKNEVVKHVQGRQSVPIFNVLGYGETLPDAMKRAAALGKSAGLHDSLVTSSPAT